MDLLRTILVYMSMVFVASVQSAPEPSLLPEVDVPTPTPYVEAAATSTPAPTPTPTPVPTIDISPNPDYKTIKVGDNGEDVRAMQQKLAEYGYYTGEIDGRFGNQTRRAVEKFQYQHGLSVDGIAGKRTLTVLYDSDDIRRAPVDATPSPSPSQTPGSGTLLTAATSGAPSNTPEPTFAPDATESTPGTDATTAAAAREPAGSLPPEASAQPHPDGWAGPIAGYGANRRADGYAGSRISAHGRIYGQACVLDSSCFTRCRRRASASAAAALCLRRNDLSSAIQHTGGCRGKHHYNRYG